MRPATAGMRQLNSVADRGRVSSAPYRRFSSASCDSRRRYPAPGTSSSSSPGVEPGIGASTAAAYDINEFTVQVDLSDTNDRTAVVNKREISSRCRWAVFLSHRHDMCSVSTHVILSLWTFESFCGIIKVILSGKYFLRKMENKERGAL